MTIEKLTYSECMVDEGKRKVKQLHISTPIKASYFNVWCDMRDVYEWLMDNVNYWDFHTEYTPFRAFSDVINDLVAHKRKVTVKELEQAKRRAYQYLKVELAEIEKMMASGEVNVVD